MNRFQVLLSNSTSAAPARWDTSSSNGASPSVRPVPPTQAGGLLRTSTQPRPSSPKIHQATHGQTGVIENKHSTARSTFARVRVNAHTDARTRFMIADRPTADRRMGIHPQLANVDLAVCGHLAVGLYTMTKCMNLWANSIDFERRLFVSFITAEFLVQAF